MINGRWPLERAQAFARRLRASGAATNPDLVRAAYRIALGRAPAAAELADSVGFVTLQAADYEAAKKADARELALTDFCQTLLCLNEFVYVD